MFVVQAEPLDPQVAIDAVASEECGGLAIFIGTVRAQSRGRAVQYLEYEAYPEMATKKMREIAEEIQVRWGTDRVAMLHRVGRLEIGEASVIVAVAAPHRREALAACHYGIDRLKQVVPIWKKEVWENGEAWIGWEGEPPAEAVPPPAARP